MYSALNVLIHCICIALFVYAFVPDHHYKAGDMTMQKFAGLVALGLFGTWALLVGVFHNLKSLFHTIQLFF